MWGCLLAVAITFPLVFGWVHFEFAQDRFDVYTAYMFGFPAFTFGIESLVGFLIFHGLVWASFLVIAGVMLAMHRRMRGHDALALQRFGEDFLPLILLFAVSITGLMLVAAATATGTPRLARVLTPVAVLGGNAVLAFSISIVLGSLAAVPLSGLWA